MVAHRNRAGFDAVDHFADATELRIREYLDLDASVGALLDQCSQFIGVPGLRRSGNADMRVVTELDAALERLAERLPKQPNAEVSFDIRELYFMNSSCFKCFVSFIVTSLDLPRQQQYKVVFLANPRMPWQDRSLEALRSPATPAR